MESELEALDLNEDYRDMAIQFGYLTMFTSVWLLVPVITTVNKCGSSSCAYSAVPALPAAWPPVLPPCLLSLPVLLLRPLC